MSSYPDSKSSLPFLGRKASYSSVNTTRHGSLVTYDDNFDYDTINIPQSVKERRASVYSEGNKSESSYPDLVGTSEHEAVYLISTEAKISPRRWLVVPYCFLYMAAYVMSSSVFVQYIYKTVQSDMFPDIDKFNATRGCYANTSSPDYKNQMLVQAKASNWNMYYSLAGGIPAMFASIVFGSSSDKFGRKFLFLLPCLGAVVRMTVCSVGIYLNFNMYYFLIGFFIEGCSGYIATMLLVSFTYVADITPPKGKQRSFAITMIELVNGIAGTVVSFATGYFIQDTGFFYPMLTSGILVAMCTVLVIFIQETFPREKRNMSESICDKFKVIYDLFFGESNKGRRWMYNILMAVFLLTMFASFGRQSVESLYQLDTPFCWSPEKIGYFGALKNLLQQMFGMGLIKLLHLVMSDESIAMLGCLSFGGGFALEGFAPNDLYMYIVPVVGVCGLLTIPICRSLLSKLTRSDHQGAIFSAIATLETAVNIGGSVAANEIYSHTLGFYRGFVFFVFSGCSIISLVLLGIYRFGSKRTFPIPLDVRR